MIGERLNCQKRVKVVSSNIGNMCIDKIIEGGWLILQYYRITLVLNLDNTLNI